MTRNVYITALLTLLVAACSEPASTPEDAPVEKASFDWKTSSIYFLLTDRFNNGDSTNDRHFERNEQTGKLRNFMGGDIKGITQKVKEGYFTDLGIDAIWFTPVFEQIHGFVDEGSGVTYGFHGYWPKDWSAIDPNYGTMDDLKELVATAHSKGIRVVMDVILNHTGPVTSKDVVWPENWVRTSPTCTYQNYITTAECTLVKNLPDVLTESDEAVELPATLIEKWKKEGRYAQEMKELDAFFAETGFPRAPRYYIMKWLVDLIKELGIDGFRVDTVKHLHEDAFAELSELAQQAFANWKNQHPEAVWHQDDFYMLGEVYGYGISGQEYYNFGDRKVNYYDHGFNSLINFEYVWDAKNDYETIFTKYDSLVNTPTMADKGVVSYISSHDDGNPYDGKRLKPYESANKLLLTPGSIQIYYGDETARSLVIAGTEGDATLRSFMNWQDLETDSTKAILHHWQKLGRFRQAHAAVAGGAHRMLQASPYTFSRVTANDRVVVALDTQAGKKQIVTGNTFEEGTQLTDYYSGKKAIVTDGAVTIDSDFTTVLLAE